MTAKLASLRAQNPTMSIEQARALIAAVDGAASITPAATIAATPVGGGPVTTASLTATCKYVVSFFDFFSYVLTCFALLQAAAPQ
jgi:hypothetical protein